MNREIIGKLDEEFDKVLTVKDDKVHIFKCVGIGAAEGLLDGLTLFGAVALVALGVQKIVGKLTKK